MRQCVTLVFHLLVLTVTETPTGKDLSDKGLLASGLQKSLSF